MIRAALFDGPGLPFRLVTFPLRDPGPGEVVLRVSLCTVCGSDLHTASGRRHGPTPCVLGHEVVGTVEHAGSEARDVEGRPLLPGQRVVVGVATGCGHCFFCQRGWPQKCESLVKLGHTKSEASRAPFAGQASHCHVPAGAAIVPVADSVPDEVAAPAGCAAATVAAVLRRAGSALEPGACILIFGAGMLGLTAAAMATARGAGTVIVCDVEESRLQRSRAFGATHTVMLPDGLALLAGIVSERTQGRGADAMLELSGSPQAAGWGLERLRVGGVAVWAGGVLPTPPVPVVPEKVVKNCLTIAGIHNYAPSDLQTALDFLAANHERFPFAKLVAATYPLEAVDEAFRIAEAERPVRIGIHPSA